MTREDLLKGNCEIAAQLGKDIRAYCPDLKLAVIIFNPADITGLTALVHAACIPKKVGTLAALDSTRLQTALSQHFKVAAGRRHRLPHLRRPRRADGGFRQHRPGAGKPLTSLIGTDGAHRPTSGRPSSPRQPGRQEDHRTARPQLLPEPLAHQSLLMVKAVMDGQATPGRSAATCNNRTSSSTS
jgi:malate dehydrogenase